MAGRKCSVCKKPFNPEAGRVRRCPDCLGTGGKKAPEAAARNAHIAGALLAAVRGIVEKELQGRDRALQTMVEQTVDARLRETAEQLAKAARA